MKKIILNPFVGKFIKSKRTFFAIVFLVFFNSLIQGYFISQIDFISPQDTGLLSITRKIVSPGTFTEAEQELMEPYKIYPPIYSAICGVIYFFTGDLDGAPKIYHIIFSSALIIPVFLISLRLYGRKTAVISSLLLTFLPALSITIYYSVRHISFIFFLYLSLYFILAGDLDNKIKYYGLGGFLLGITYLIREEVLIILFAVLLVIFLKGLLKKNGRFEGIYKKELVVICLFLPLFLLSSLYTYNSTGKWSLGGDKKWKYDHFITGQGILDGIKTPDIEYGYKVYGSAEENNNSILNAIKKHPKAYFSRIINNFKILFDVLPSPAVIPFYLYLFMGIAFFELLGNPDRLKCSIIFIAVIVSFISLWTVVFFVQAKHLVPLVPILAIWISYGIKLTQDKIRMRNLIYFPSIITLLSLAVIFLTYTKSISEDIPRETKEIGGWLKENTSSADIIVVPNEWFDERLYLQYYSRRKVREIPAWMADFKNGINIKESIFILKDDQFNSNDNKLTMEIIKIFENINKKIIVYRGVG
ncbi:MAG: glycosyltransferase family 39 protein [Candidatus Omnitrophota bacterium]